MPPEANPAQLRVVDITTNPLNNDIELATTNIIMTIHDTPPPEEEPVHVANMIVLFPLFVALGIGTVSGFAGFFTLVGASMQALKDHNFSSVLFETEATVCAGAIYGAIFGFITPCLLSSHIENMVFHRPQTEQSAKLIDRYCTLFFQLLILASAPTGLALYGQSDRLIYLRGFLHTIIGEILSLATCITLELLSRAYQYIAPPAVAMPATQTMLLTQTPSDAQAPPPLALTTELASTTHNP